MNPQAAGGCGGEESQTSSSLSMQEEGGSDLMTDKSFDNTNLARQKLTDTIFHLHVLPDQQLAMLVSSSETSCSRGAFRAGTGLPSLVGVPGSHHGLAAGKWIARSTGGDDNGPQGGDVWMQDALCTFSPLKIPKCFRRELGFDSCASFHNTSEVKVPPQWESSGHLSNADWLYSGGVPGRQLKGLMRGG